MPGWSTRIRKRPSAPATVSAVVGSPREASTEAWKNENELSPVGLTSATFAPATPPLHSPTTRPATK
jgi:hypothetical protein